MGTGEESRRGWHAGIKASAPLWRRTWSREKVCRISVSRCCSYIFLRFRTCGGNAGEAQAVRRETAPRTCTALDFTPACALGGKRFNCSR